MLTFVRGSLFEAPAKVLVNTVNTVGVMGKGIALTFKEIYPEMFKRYVELCEAKQIDIGNLWLYKTPHKWVLNFPTKKHWRQPSKLEYVEAGLQKFVANYAKEKITSIAFPELGCGNGELDRADVHPLMKRYLADLPINIYIYLYEQDRKPVAEHRDIEAMRKWLRSEPRTLSFHEFWNDVKEIVGSRCDLRKSDGEPYVIQVEKYECEGLLLHIGDRTAFQRFRDDVRKFANSVLGRWRYASKRAIFIPEESLLDLWQSIRFYGFCSRRMMPSGLDLLSDYLMPLLRRISYLRSVSISGTQLSKIEEALQLYAGTASEPKEKIAELVSA